jgi:hypothetical protein
LWGSLRDKVYKTTPYNLEEPGNNIRRDVSTVPGPRTPESKSRVLLVYWLHSFRRATFSASAEALVSFYQTF